MDENNDCLVPKRKIDETIEDEPPDKKVCSEVSKDNESLNKISENTDSVSLSVEYNLANNLNVKGISDELRKKETLNLNNSCSDDGTNSNICQESKDNNSDNELKNHNGELAEVNTKDSINDIVEIAEAMNQTVNINVADSNDSIVHQPSTANAQSIPSCNNDKKESTDNNSNSELKNCNRDLGEVNTSNSMDLIAETDESMPENVNSDGGDLNNPGVLQPSTANAQSIPREKCRYGSQCYRLNSEHKTRFSHPGDPDFDLVDTRPECQYGKNCYRKNDQHKLDYKHTENKRKKRNPTRRQSPQGALSWDETDEESVDESDEYEPSFIDDESEEELESDFEGDDT